MRLSCSGADASPDTAAFVRYLAAKRAGPVDVGDEWVESINVGCGRTKAVALSVEAVVGGDEFAADTDVEFVDRSATAERE